MISAANTRSCYSPILILGPDDREGGSHVRTGIICALCLLVSIPSIYILFRFDGIDFFLENTVNFLHQ